MHTKQPAHKVFEALKHSLEVGEAINEAALLVTLLADDAFNDVKSAHDLPIAYERAEDTIGQGLKLFKDSKLYSTCSGAIIDEAINRARDLLMQETHTAIANSFLEMAAERGTKSRSEELPLPAPLMNFASGLLESAQRSVTLQHTLSLGSLCSLERPEEATVEVLKATPIALLVTRLLGATLKLKTENELFSPGEATRDWVLAAPPMAMKLKTKVRDYHYSQEASLHKILAEGREKAVLLAPTSILTLRSSFTLRKKLIDEGLLEAVVQLPKGTLKFTSVAPVLLLIDRTRMPGESVQFHDLESLDTETARAALGAIRARKPGHTGCLANQNDVRRQDYDLTVNRYKLGVATKAMEELKGTVSLEGLAKLVKTQSLPSLDTDTEGQDFYLEIAPKDIGENGIITTPEKKVVVDAKYERRANNQRVQAGDILLVVKGSVTNVGYVPMDCPDNWIAGQAFMIIRPQPKIGTEYLFQYLSSDLVQGYLKERAFGDAMSIIKPADIETIPVPLPEPKELKEIRETHEQIRLEYAAIEEHRKVIEQLKNKLWALPN